MTGRARRPERGAALLVAIISIAVLTALAVDLAYESRVSLRIAANARDELRASYLARSGVTLSRLVLSFQQTLDDASKPPAGAGAAAAAFSIPRVQLWRLVPVGSDLAGALFGGGGEGAPPPAAATPEGGAAAGEGGGAPGELRSGTFDAVLDDEARKVNAQLEGLPRTNLTLTPQVQALYQLICDPKWDALFEREDANGVRTSREELLVRLRDWVDDGSTDEGLQAISGGTHCALVVQQPAFEPAFGDENQPYDRGDDRYRSKNARMDSLDELFMVAGVGDAFMAAFGDALTVYLPRDAKRNVNELDRTRLVQNAALIADRSAESLQKLVDPQFGTLLQALVMERTLGGLLAITPAEFAQLVQAAGIEKINASLVDPKNVNRPFTDRSDTFRIRSSGRSGDVTTAIDAVVRLAAPAPGEPVAAPGRLIHWREE